MVGLGLVGAALARRKLTTTFPARAAVERVVRAAMACAATIAVLTTFGIVLAAMATTSALYVLRRRRPDHPRPYRAWGYPLVPAFYLLTNGAVAAALLWGRPRECAIALAVIASGLPFLHLFRKRNEEALR